VNLYRSASLPSQLRGKVRVRSLLPESVAGLSDGSNGVSARRVHGRNSPHAGTREYLTCEIGKVQLSAGGMAWELGPGDVLVFRGDQKHGYRNLSSDRTVAYSVVAFAPVAV
jgi:hypothetical protein